jgi:hypothetical protein
MTTEIAATTRVDCPMCGRPLRPKGSDVLVSRAKRKRRPRKYCSPRCQRRAAYERKFTTPATSHQDSSLIGGKNHEKSIASEAPVWRVIAGRQLSPKALRLATLPLDPVTEARVCRANARVWDEAAIVGPKDVPINLIGGYHFPNAPPLPGLSWTESCLTGLAELETEAPSIVPDLPSDGGDLEIPLFLQRSTTPAVPAQF